MAPETQTLTVVDAHHHFWDLTANQLPWLTGERRIGMRYGDYSTICRNYLPPDYFADAGRVRVSQSVYVETEWDPDDPVGETKWINGLASETGYPNAVVAQAWFERDNISEVLGGHAEYNIVRSIRQKPTTTHSPFAPHPGPRGSMSEDKMASWVCSVKPTRLVFRSANTVLAPSRGSRTRS